MQLNKNRQELVDMFLSALKEDTIPWQAVWQEEKPINPVSNHVYRGINNLMLNAVAREKGYTDPRWCTFNQAQENGWRINKGEKSSKVEYWAYTDPETRKMLPWAETRKIFKDDPERFRTLILKCRISYVFNGEQITGIPPYVRQDPTNIDSIRQQRDTLIKNMGVTYTEQGNQPYYFLSKDTVVLPPEGSFFDPYGYMSTLLHECGHATGHESRLNRDMTGSFGSPEYAREELRAEIASAFAVQSLGMEMPEESMKNHMELHKAYIQSWISILENDPNALFSAIREAEKISDYLIEKGEFAKVLENQQEQTVSVSKPKSVPESKPVTYEGWNFEGGYVDVDTLKNQIQLHFKGVPSVEIRTELKKNHFRWSPKDKVWYCKLTAETYNTAKTIPSIKPGLAQAPVISTQPGWVEAQTAEIHTRIIAIGRDEYFMTIQPIQGSTVSLRGIPENIPHLDKITTLSIQEGITRISDRVLDQFPQLQTVKLPKSLQEIGYGAMENCHQLKEIEFKGTVEQWDSIHKGFGSLPEQFVLERSYAEQGRLGEEIHRPVNICTQNKGSICFQAQEAPEPVLEMEQKTEQSVTVEPEPEPGSPPEPAIENSAIAITDVIVVVEDELELER